MGKIPKSSVLSSKSSISYHKRVSLVGSIVKSGPPDCTVCMVGVGPVREQKPAHLIFWMRTSDDNATYFHKTLFCGQKKSGVAIAVRLVNILSILEPVLNLIMNNNLIRSS